MKNNCHFLLRKMFSKSRVQFEIRVFKNRSKMSIFDEISKFAEITIMVRCRLRKHLSDFDNFPRFSYGMKCFKNYDFQ